MSKRAFMPLLTAALLACATGCGNYTITFEQESVINTYNNDASKSQQLEVDIVCLDKDEARRVPDLARGAINCKEWFMARGGKSTDRSLAGLKQERVYSLSNDGEWKRRTSPLGDALLPTDRYKDGNPNRKFTFKFPEFLDGDAVVLVYGKFLSDQGVRDLPPIRLSPPPKDDKITIRVGQEGMTRIEK